MNTLPRITPAYLEGLTGRLANLERKISAITDGLKLAGFYTCNQCGAVNNNRAAFFTYGHEAICLDCLSNDDDMLFMETAWPFYLHEGIKRIFQYAKDAGFFIREGGKLFMSREHARRRAEEHYRHYVWNPYDGHRSGFRCREVALLGHCAQQVVMAAAANPKILECFVGSDRFPGYVADLHWIDDLRVYATLEDRNLYMEVNREVWEEYAALQAKLNQQKPA